MPSMDTAKHGRSTWPASHRSQGQVPKKGKRLSRLTHASPAWPPGLTANPRALRANPRTVSPGGHAGWENCRLAVNLNRVRERGTWSGPYNRITLLGWKLADGYLGLEPVQRLDLHQPAALRVAGVRWVLRGPAADRIEGLAVRDSRWLEVPRPLPYVRLVTQSRQTEDPARDIRRIDVETTALADEPLGLCGGPAGRILDAAQQPGRVEARVDCPARQLLVVAESYHPGWLARVDGRPQPVHRINGDFLGCLVGPGSRQVTFEFRPRSLAIGRVTSFCGLGLVMVSLAMVPLSLRERVGVRGNRQQPDQAREPGSQ